MIRCDNASCASGSNVNTYSKYSGSMISNMMKGMIMPNTNPTFPGKTILKMGQWMII